MREADLQRHLGNDKDPNAERKPEQKDKAPATVEDEAAETPRFELAGKDDRQLDQAINLLKGLQIVQNKNR